MLKRIGPKTRFTGAVAAASIALVGAWEGLRLTAYRDIVGVPTVCFGETRGVKIGDRYTREQCDVMLGDRLREFEAEMHKCLKDPESIPDGAYVAFLSASYNIGSRAFCGSSMVRHANAGNLAAACDALLLWNKAGGKVVKGLINRRKEERALCLGGIAK